MSKAKQKNKARVLSRAAKRRDKALGFNPTGKPVAAPARPAEVKDRIPAFGQETAAKAERARVNALVGVKKITDRLGVGFDLEKAITRIVSARAAGDAILERMAAADEAIGEISTAAGPPPDPGLARKDRVREARRRGMKGKPIQQPLRR